MIQVTIISGVLCMIVILISVFLSEYKHKKTVRLTIFCTALLLVIWCLMMITNCVLIER